MLQNKKFENEFFSFLLKKKRENDDKSRPRNEFRPKRRSQGVTDNTKQADQSRLTNLSKNPIKENTRNLLMKRKLC
jgi:hypothetical protein